MMIQYVRFFLIFFISLSTFSQSPNQQIINGKVIDSLTGETIPLCNIIVESTTVGTISNELGEFSIRVDSLPVTLYFSHLNHAKQKVEISEISDLIVELIPLTTQLEEVTVHSIKKNKFALELAKKAYSKAIQNSAKSNYGKAFYRQKSKNGDSYSEFSEIIYDIKYNASKIEDWSILEGRYALKTGGVHNKNFTLLSRLLAPVQPATDELVFPIHPDFESYYNLRIIDYIESESNKIAVIWFQPKEYPIAPTFEAEVYIDTKTFDILKISGEIHSDDLKLVRLAEKKSHWKNYELTYEIAYQQDNSNGGTVIDYVKIDNTFDYYKNDSLKFKVTSKSNLIFYEHYKPTSRKKLGGQFYSKRSDWQNLNKIGYNRKFWEENPIVKRTGVEEDVISSFEKNNSFGTIFLNSRDQVALMQSELVTDPIIQKLDTKLNLYNNYNPTEKVYLHTDKDIFTSGENLWYSGYTVLGSYHNYSLASKVLYVDLIGPNNKVIHTQTNEIISGRSSGNIELPNSLIPGNYQIRAYTQWMRNFEDAFFFTKNIQIFGDNNNQIATLTDEKIDLQFFPEGGHMVDGITGLVAFKAIGNDGKERTIKGNILNSKGKVVAKINTIENGAGYFHLKPSSDEVYIAKLSDGLEYKLPKVLSQGYEMTVNNVSPKSIAVKVQATKSFKENPFYIVGHVNNKKYYQAKFNFGQDASVNFEVPKNWVPSGIMTLTLFDENLKPWCERIVFINNQEELVITTKATPQEFEKRAKIAVDIHVTDIRGNPISTDLSVAITDMGQVEKDKNASTIITQLLLESDIKGNIKNPGMYFRDQKRATMHRLDLVMLTHGWRKFSWPEVMGKDSSQNEFFFSKGLPFSGSATGSFDKPLRNKNLTVIAKSIDDIGMFTAKTSEDGKFVIPDFNFKGPTSIVINAYDSKNRQVNAKVVLDSNSIKLPVTNFNGRKLVYNKGIEEYIEYSSNRKKMDSLYNADITTNLEEVVVTKKIVRKVKASRPSELGITADATIYANKFRGVFSVLHLVSMLPSVSVMGTTVSIRNNGTPLWVVDGIPVRNENPNASVTALKVQADAQKNSERKTSYSVVRADIALGIEGSQKAIPAPSYITTMDTFSVERVELLRGPSAAIYGSRGANGVILIYTKRGESRDPVLSPEFTIDGHVVEREFYSPKYDLYDQLNSAPDHRATLLWDPTLKTDENGNARVEFFNSDSAKQLQISIEGLNSEGIPGAYLKAFGTND